MSLCGRSFHLAYRTFRSEKSLWTHPFLPSLLGASGEL